MTRAIALVAVAFVVISCKSRLKTTSMDLADRPVQVVNDMYVVQTDKGKMQMRVQAAVMERYQNDSVNWEIFPSGFCVYSYNEEGKLETEIVAEQARHTKPKEGQELWAAYNNVKIRNLINRELMETDTLYWDPNNERIYTDCYVSILSPSGFMQGYGMESDQRARSSVILRPFNSYGIMEEQDSTVVVLDSVNFIGPFPKK